MENISSLLERFLSAQKSDSIVYFDLHEIEALINYFFTKDDLENLKASIELGFKIYPNDINFKVALCQVLMSIEDLDSTIKLIEENDIKGNKYIDLIRLECYCELDRYDDALRIIDELTANSCPYLEDAVTHMACVMNDIEKYQENAYNFIQHALTMFPDNFALKSELCFNYELRGNTKEALELCRQLIDEDPYSSEVWYMQGRLYSLFADFEKAVDSFDFAITCTNDNSELEYEIKLTKALCLYKNESYDLAICCYKELTTYDEFDNSQIAPYLAECYININEYEKAYDILKCLIGNEELEDEVSVYGNFIYSCIETDRGSEAIEVLGDALKRFPHSILEYISTLNIMKNQLPDIFSGKENVVYPGELARKYISSSIHNN